MFSLIFYNFFVPNPLPHYYSHFPLRRKEGGESLSLRYWRRNRVLLRRQGKRGRDGNYEEKRGEEWKGEERKAGVGVKKGKYSDVKWEDKMGHIKKAKKNEAEVKVIISTERGSIKWQV